MVPRLDYTYNSFFNYNDLLWATGGTCVLFLWEGPLNHPAGPTLIPCAQTSLCGECSVHSSSSSLQSPNNEVLCKACWTCQTRPVGVELDDSECSQKQKYQGQTWVFQSIFFKATRHSNTDLFLSPSPSSSPQLMRINIKVDGEMYRNFCNMFWSFKSLHSSSSNRHSFPSPSTIPASVHSYTHLYLWIPQSCQVGIILPIFKEAQKGIMASLRSQR